MERLELNAMQYGGDITSVVIEVPDNTAWCIDESSDYEYVRIMTILDHGIIDPDNTPFNCMTFKLDNKDIVILNSVSRNMVPNIISTDDMFNRINKDNILFVTVKYIDCSIISVSKITGMTNDLQDFVVTSVYLSDIITDRNVYSITVSGNIDIVGVLSDIECNFSEYRRTFEVNGVELCNKLFNDAVNEVIKEVNGYRHTNDEKWWITGFSINEDGSFSGVEGFNRVMRLLGKTNNEI